MTYSNKKLSTVIVMLAIISANVYAHKGATGIVKQRMDSMSEMKDSMKIMADMIKGKSEFNSENVRHSADILVEHSKILLDYFPNTDESRSGGESEALPLIWTSWDQFEEHSNKFKIAVDALKQASDEELNKRSLRLVFARTAKACSSCHDDFRRPKE